MVALPDTDSVPLPFVRYHLVNLPKVHGHLLIVGCGDSRLYGSGDHAISDVMSATGAPWGFLKTFAGGSAAPTTSLAVAKAFADEIQGLEQTKGVPFAGIVDIAHLNCAGLDLLDPDIPVENQLATIGASQLQSVPMYARYFPGLPVYCMAYDCALRIWWT